MQKHTQTTFGAQVKKNANQESISSLLQKAVQKAIPKSHKTVNTVKPRTDFNAALSAPTKKASGEWAEF